MVAETYEIIKGELVVLRAQNSPKYLLFRMRFYMVRSFVVLCTVVGSWSITWFVYYNSITQSLDANGLASFSLQDRIATSSLFATFGSALIAVFTLFTSSSLTRFQEDLSILVRELTGNEIGDITWRRWPFIPHINKQRLAGKTQYFALRHATIYFHIGEFERSFPLPTTKADFAEVSALVHFLRLKRLRASYVNQLVDLNLIREYPAWDCVTDIYRRILYYRICYFCVWLGVCFVLESIIFAFLYPWFYSLFISIPCFHC